MSNTPLKNHGKEWLVDVFVGLVPCFIYHRSSTSAAHVDTILLRSWVITDQQSRRRRSFQTQQKHPDFVRRLHKHLGFVRPGPMGVGRRKWNREQRSS